MPKPPAVGTPWFEHPRIFELVEDVVDLVLA
jgi:hypothetical protein